ncbi:MAG: DUF5915 domain-containing protein, partial [Chloroflexota bacterium]
NAVEPVKASLSELDRWILSELNTLVGEVSRLLDVYDPTGAGRVIESFVDVLSNWYVRRGRRRFWKSESDQDKAAAYATLYECLVTVSKLLAPFTPFLAEELWQNLVRTARPAATESVHLIDFPEVDRAYVDEALMNTMRTVTRLVSLGRAARSKAQVKVRQPLAAAIFKVDSGTTQQTLTPLLGQIAEELNVKKVSFVDDPAVLVSYALRPKLNLLGPKYGRELSKVTAALQRLNPSEVLRAQRTGSPVRAETWTLAPEEIEVTRTEKPGLSVVDEGDLLAAVSTEITPELQDEGLARELVRLVQTMRKAAGFNIEDRIATYYAGDETVDRVLALHGDYVRQETLSERLTKGEPPVGIFVESHKPDGHAVVIGVVRAI